MKPFQPYPRLEEMYLPEFLKKGKRYFVSQYYKRGEGRWHDYEQKKIPIVFTLYKDLTDAEVHLNAVRKTEQYAAIIDLQNPKHMDKVKEMLQPGSNYDVFISMVWKIEETDTYLEKHYDKHIERYIAQKLNWRIPREEGIDTGLKIIFGLPFLYINWRNNKVQVKFEEIENA